MGGAADSPARGAGDAGRPTVRRIRAPRARRRPIVRGYHVSPCRGRPAAALAAEPAPAPGQGQESGAAVAPPLSPLLVRRPRYRARTGARSSR